MTNAARNPLGLAVLGVLALAAIIGGVILTTSGHDAATLWTLAGTAAGAIGGVLMPGASSSSEPSAPLTLVGESGPETYVARVDGGHPTV